MMVYPQECEAAEPSEERPLEGPEGVVAEDYPPIHPLVPRILNERVPASSGKVRPVIMGLLEATTAWQAFEDMVTATFRVLDFGDVHPLVPLPER